MRKFGLIGYPLTHSFSQRFFTEKFEREGIVDCVYTNFSLPSIEALPAVLADTELRGLNVTIPYKEKVLDYLDDLSPVARAVGACNCIRIESGRMVGHNTDAVGFERSLQPLIIDSYYPHPRVLILGRGGAAKAVEYVVKRMGLEYRMVIRGVKKDPTDLHYEEVDEAIVSRYKLIINTTPLGMYPHVDECAPLPYEAIGPDHILFDLIYNPAKTLFLLKGEERGAVVKNGHEMLVLQAEESWRIWNT
jgi:shikimate dehydrogenase